MGRFLQALRSGDFEKATTEPTKPTNVPSVGFVGGLPGKSSDFQNDGATLNALRQGRRECERGVTNGHRCTETPDP